MTAQHQFKQVVAPAYDEKLRAWLQKHQDENPHLSDAVLAQEGRIGGSRAQIYAYRKATYFLSKEQGGSGVGKSDIEDRIRAYKDRVEGSIQFSYAKTFRPTRAWKQFEHACATAISERVMVVVYGDPGVGKTECLKRYSVSNSIQMPIQILCSRNITTPYFVRKIAMALGINPRHTTAELEDMVAEKLIKKPRAIFVDQANYLKETALGSICYWWDITHAPVVLIGTRDLYDLFVGSDMTQDVRAQITSRVAMHYQLFGLSKEEVKAIASEALGADATTEVCAKLYEITGGKFRHIDMVIPRFKDLRAASVEKLKADQITLEQIMTTAGLRLMVD